MIKINPWKTTLWKGTSPVDSVDPVESSDPLETVSGTTARDPSSMRAGGQDDGITQTPSNVIGD